jgi:hypothetical protein
MRGKSDQILVVKSQDRTSADTLSTLPSGRRWPAILHSIRIST